MRNGTCEGHDPQYFEHVWWQGVLIRFFPPDQALHGVLESHTRWEEADLEMVFSGSTRVKADASR